MVIYRTKKEQVYETLKNEILLGILEPGHQIDAASIAKRLDVSENPVRAAIQQLEMQGLVLIKPYVGTVIASYSKEELKNIYEIRILLESLAVKQSINNINNLELKRLHDILKASWKAIEERDFLTVALLNKDFHMEIYKSSGNIHLIKVIEDFWSKIFRYSLSLYTYELVLEFHKEHTEIVQALSEKDVVRTEKLLLQHQNGALNKVLKANNDD